MRDGSWTRTLAPLLGGVLAVGGCGDDQLVPPEPAAGELFARYVAIGNSITAGFQSGGINDSTQRQSYAALVAGGMGTEFQQPLFRKPGCPPPLVDVFAGQRLGGGAADDCALRATPVPTRLNNVAVPGAATRDVVTNLGDDSRANPLTSLILGGRTQLEAAAEVQPTFVSVWIGNNDVLGAARSGDTDRITPPETFAEQYAAMVDSLAALGLQGAVLIGVADVTLIPALSPGAAYLEAEGRDAFPPTYDVADNCAPSDLGGVGDSTLVPFEYGFGVLLEAANAGQAVTLDCVAADSVLTVTEVAEVQAAVESFNRTIETAAEAWGWAFLNINPEFRDLKDLGFIPIFPVIPDGPPEAGVPRSEPPFGPLFSLDGIHPSAGGHTRIADLVIEAVNDRYGTTIPTILE